jgi:tRNA(Leu) C34 or U34 (ribose-2'-O)-methylase TrmL
MEEKTRSLNLANVASVVIFEALRQIHAWPGPVQQ